MVGPLINFTAKFGLVFVLTLENAFTYRFHFKVVRVVNLKLVFTNQYFCNLVVLIKLYKIRYLN